MKKPHVVHVLPSLDFGGNESLRVALGSALASRAPSARPFDVSFCALARGGAVAEELRAIGFQVAVLGRSAHPLALRTTWALARWLSTLRPDIVHACALEANVHAAGAVRLAGIRHFVTEETGVPTLRPGWARAISGMAHRSALLTVAQSRGVAKYLREQEGLLTERIQLVYNCAELDRLPTQQSARSALAVEGARPIVGTVGRLSPEKGHDLLLRAFAEVHARHPQGILLIAGAGPWLKHLRGLTAELGIGKAVRFLGLRRDIETVLAALDVFVLPSRTEGLPVALVEAALAGVPIVATDVDGIPEVIEDGRTGRLVAPDSGQIATAIESVLGDPTRASLLRDAAQADVGRRFGVPRYVSDLTALYERVIDA